MLKSFLAAVILSATVDRCFVSRMRDFFFISRDVVMPKPLNKTAQNNLVFSPMQRAARLSRFFRECQYFSSPRETQGGTKYPSGALNQGLFRHDQLSSGNFLASYLTERRFSKDERKLLAILRSRCFRAKVNFKKLF